MPENQEKRIALRLNKKLYNELIKTLPPKQTLSDLTRKLYIEHIQKVNNTIKE